MSFSSLESSNSIYQNHQVRNKNDSYNSPDPTDDHRLISISNSSLILRKGRFELISFNYFNFYENVSENIDNQLNQKLLGNNLQISFGLSNQINIGVDLLTSTQFNNYNLGADLYKFRYHYYGIGPRIRWTPFANKQSKTQLVIQHFLIFPLNSDNSLVDNFQIQQQPYYQNPIVGNQLAFTHRLGYNLLILAQFELLMFLDEEEKKNNLILPANLVLGYAINSIAMPYLQVNSNYEFGGVAWDIENNYYLLNQIHNIGIGIQFRLPSNLFINTAFLTTIHKDKINGYNSINFGFRISPN